ncbi:hypothetical protein MKX01_041134 [Papaver californicum]|nr:hypothetical protein MKX01_041134 [Papaver californicum]
MPKQKGSGVGDQYARVPPDKQLTAAGDSSSMDKSPPFPLKRKRTSEAWNEFEQIKEDGKVVKGKCKHCNLKLCAKSANGTSSLNKHLKSYGLFKTAQKQLNQMFLKASVKENGALDAYNFNFNQEVTRDRTERMIILHELPFSMVEYLGFRMVLTSLQPNFKLVKRNTERSDCMKVYNSEKKLLYETFSKVQSRISLTTDIWACNSQNKGYMALTAHYIDEKWRIKKRILSFSAVDRQHTRVNIAKVMMDKLLEWNIDRKIASITLDNASTNGVVVSELIKQLKPDNGLLIDGKLFQVWCSSHVIAIIVDYGME